MKLLTIKQPWASLICLGIKDVENRTWKQNCLIGETILIMSSMGDEDSLRPIQNGVKNIKALLGDASVIKTIDGTFDIVLANINRNILLNDMEAMRSKMASGTTFIISGFYEEDIPLLVDKASALGLSLKEQKGKGQWRCLVFQG